MRQPETEPGAIQALKQLAERTMLQARSERSDAEDSFKYAHKAMARAAQYEAEHAELLAAIERLSED